MKILFFITFLTFSLYGRSQIKYGSNNGKYLTIKGTKVYYEEYGQGIPLLLAHGGPVEMRNTSTRTLAKASAAIGQ